MNTLPKMNFLFQMAPNLIPALDQSLWDWQRKKLTKLYEAGKKKQSKIQNFARLKKRQTWIS